MSEELSYDTLLSLMKEKTKESNNLSKKVSKLEERYVAKHRESTELRSERDILASFVQSILESQLPREGGKLRAEDLETAWTLRDEQDKRTMRATVNAATDEIQKLREELKAYKEDLHTKSTHIAELETSLTDYSHQKRQVATLTSELEQQKLLFDKIRLENSQLKAQHEEMSVRSTNKLLAAFGEGNSEEVDSLKKQLQDAQGRIALLETKLEEKQGLTDRYEEGHFEEMTILRAKHEQEIEELKARTRSLKKELAEQREKAQKIVLEKEQVIDRLRRRVQQAESVTENEELAVLRRKLAELESFNSHDNVNMEYIKQIVIRFMEYMYTGNAKEAATIATVISTVLKFTEEEMLLVQSARQSSKFYKTFASFFGTKSPGVGISHNSMYSKDPRVRSMLESSHLQSQNSFLG